MRRLALAALALAASTTPAFASERTIDTCRHTDGTPATTDGWATTINDTGTGNIATNSCAQGGHIDLALSAGTHSPQASVLLTGTLPPGAPWTRMQAWLAYTATPVASAGDPANLVSGTLDGTPLCPWGHGTGCSQFGVMGAAPLSDVNRITVTPSSPTQPLQLGVLCDSTPNPCPATSGDPYATMRIWRIAVTINEPDPPAQTTPATHDPGQPAPRVHNGTGNASYGYLTARVRRDRNGRVYVSGRLTDLKHHAISNAQLVLKRTPGQAVRVTTGRTGRYHRVLNYGRRVVVGWYPWTDSTKHLQAKGKTR